MPDLLLNVIALLPVGFGALLVYDQLVRLEYGSYMSDWEQDGRPRGIFWSPPGAAPQSPAFWVWLFKTPEWARADGRARRLLLAFRLLVLAWNLGCVLLVFVPMVMSM